MTVPLATLERFLTRRRNEAAARTLEAVAAALAYAATTRQPADVTVTTIRTIVADHYTRRHRR